MKPVCRWQEDIGHTASQVHCGHQHIEWDREWDRREGGRQRQKGKQTGVVSQQDRMSQLTQEEVLSP